MYASILKTLQKFMVKNYCHNRIVQSVPKKLYIHNPFLHLANQIVYKVKNMRDVSHMETTTPQSSFQVHIKDWPTIWYGAFILDY